MPNLRSLLLLPAHQSASIDAAATSTADVVVLDLESGVPTSEKATARASLAPAAERLKSAGKQIHVRINGLDSGLASDDLAAAIGPALDGITLPNVRAAYEIRDVDVLIRQQEILHEVRPGTALLYPHIGSAAGLLRAEDILLASTRIGGLALDSESYTADLGIVRTPSGRELDYARSTLVNCCVAYRLKALDGLMPLSDDAAALTQDVERVRAVGMAGKYIAEADQADIANRVFVDG